MRRIQLYCEETMTDHRFADTLFPHASNEPVVATGGFLLVPVATVETAPASPLQWLYQQMYEQAVRASQQPPLRDLLAIMN
jgi:hypothetical protein